LSVYHEIGINPEYANIFASFNTQKNKKRRIQNKTQLRKKGGMKEKALKKKIKMPNH
jgi:hypothetical protein